MGYQKTRRLIRLCRVLGAALSRRLTLMRGSAAAHLDGATRVRFSYGLPEDSSPHKTLPRPGRGPLKAADFDARLRRGAPHRRDTSSILAWATRRLVAS